MTQIQFPNQQIIDFGDLSQDEISQKIASFKEKTPQLFEEAPPEIDYETASLDEIRAAKGRPSGTTRSDKEEKELLPEVTDKSFRFNLGRKDTDEERLNYIQTVMDSEEAVKQDVDGSFLIDQGLLSEDVRIEFGLQDSGLVYADRPGFTWYDMIDFGGEAAAPLVGGIGASLLIAGTG